MDVYEYQSKLNINTIYLHSLYQLEAVQVFMDHYGTGPTRSPNIDTNRWQETILQGKNSDINRNEISSLSQILASIFWSRQLNPIAKKTSALSTPI